MSTSVLEWRIWSCSDWSSNCNCLYRYTFRIYYIYEVYMKRIFEGLGLR